MKRSFSLAIASAFYIGFIPGAPGTYASIATALAFLGINYFTHWLWIPPVIHLSAVCLLSLIGVLVSAEVSRSTGIEDPSFVVIDEVAGQLLTFLFLPIGFFNLIFGLIAFRAFDIWKPFPIRKLESLGQGVGVMTDDLLAGVYANLSLHILNYLLSLL
jgi:phosphatidylglycerophosphatase A